MLEKQDELLKREITDILNKAGYKGNYFYAVGSIKNGENKIENKYFGGRKDINGNLHFLRPEIPNKVVEDHKRKMEENPNTKVLITIIDKDYTY